VPDQWFQAAMKLRVMSDAEPPAMPTTVMLEVRVVPQTAGAEII
jgi:hypothetical protein